jgi:hypothetical protein
MRKALPPRNAILDVLAGEDGAMHAREIASRLGVTQENEHPWFWTLIGVDQALHHLTGFGLSIFMAAN